MPISKLSSYIIIALVLITAYMSPFAIMGEDVPVLIHDNLDSNLVWHTNLVNSGELFGSMDSTIPQVMNGLPRNCLGSEFNAIKWLFYIFQPFTAYALNLTIMHFVAFFGMYLLLSRHVIKEEGDIYDIITVGVALSFSLLPFWPFGGLSIAGMPLALYAFLNIRDRSSTYKDWLIICLLPLYSSLALSYFFFLVAMGFFWAIDLFRKKDTNPAFFGAICLMTIIFLMVEYRLVYSMFFDSGYVSHRVEKMSLDNGANELKKALLKGMSNFIYGQYHANSIHHVAIGISLFAALASIQSKLIFKNENRLNSFVYIIVLVVVGTLITYNILPISILIMWVSILFLLSLLATEIFALKCLGQKSPNAIIQSIYSQKNNVGSEHKFLIAIVLLCLSISIFYGFWNSGIFNSLKENFTLLSAFNFARFHFLQPLLWYIIFALTLRIVYKNMKYGKYIVLILLLTQVGYLFSFEGEFHQAGGIGSIRSEQMSYGDFYSPYLFQEIVTHIGEPQETYRVVSIGIHPSVSQYNGFYTLDSYQANYPLEYKHKFRNIIEVELDKDKVIRDYFDQWGSRCYVFTSETEKDYLITKDRSLAIQDLQFNTTAFKEMQGTYVLSAVEIENNEMNNLHFIRVFENSSSPWKVWLYEAV